MIEIGLNQDDKLVIRFSYDKELVEFMHLLPSRNFNKKTKLWEVPLLDLPIVRDVLEPYVKKHRAKIVLTPGARQKYLLALEYQKKLQAISKLDDIEYETVGLREGTVLYPFQKVGAFYLEQAKKALLAFDMGLGKFQNIDSKLLTSNGWIRMGDIKLNDEVYGSDGNLHGVTGIFPQGMQDCYDIEFTDGSKTTSGDEHLWVVQSPCQKLRETGYKTKQLKDFKDNLHEKNGNTKWFIPMVKPIQFNEKILPIDPYVLGALIGDGGLGTKNNVSFSTADQFIIMEISKFLPCKIFLKHKDGYNYRVNSNESGNINSINRIIKDLKLNVLSNKKHIPDIYKFASVNQRIALLQGLMDTDGGVDSKDGIAISYTSVSERLIDDVQFIIESLGGKAKKSSRIPQFTYKGKNKKGQRAYRLNISLPPEIKPFRLPRKLNAYVPRSKYQPYRGIKSVTYIGKKECQCISVDSPDHLYVTDHCILTHNTIIAIAASARLLDQGKIKKPLIVCPASLKYSWALELAKFSNFSYTIIDGDAKNRKKRYHNSSDFTIMNYDLLRHDIDTIHEIEWDLLIADEVQRAKNFTTAISRNLRTIQPEYIFGLTGTPIENELMDLFTIMRVINSLMFGSNGLYFKERYCITDNYGGILGHRNELFHEIDRKTSFFMIRRKKRDVLSDLPEKIVKFYHVSLNAEERTIYNRYKKQVVSNFHDVDLGQNVGEVTSANVLTQIVYLREICDSINLVEPQVDIISSKLDELKNILADIPIENKVVIFSEYERMAKIIEDNVPYQSVHLHGGIENDCKLEREIEKDIKKQNKDLEGRDLDLKIHEAKQAALCKNCPYFNDIALCNTRKKIISKFNDDPNVRLFISTNAGKEGLNLQVAPVVINYDMSFNPAVNEQRIARIDRIGQKSDKILVINLVCHETIEENILKILEDKQALFDTIIDKANKTDKDILRKMTVEDLVQLM